MSANCFQKTMHVETFYVQTRLHLLFCWWLEGLYLKKALVLKVNIPWITVWLVWHRFYVAHASVAFWVFWALFSFHNILIVYIFVTCHAMIFSPRFWLSSLTSTKSCKYFDNESLLFRGGSMFSCTGLFGLSSVCYVSQEI